MSTIRLTLPDEPGEVIVHLPMNMGKVGEVLLALGELGFILPDMIGATKMTVEADLMPKDGV